MSSARLVGSQSTAAWVDTDRAYVLVEMPATTAARAVGPSSAAGGYSLACARERVAARMRELAASSRHHGAPGVGPSHTSSGVTPLVLRKSMRARLTSSARS